MDKLINYTQAIQTIKDTILKSRYRADVLANKELLHLYFVIGEYVSLNTRNKNWGKGAIEIISEKLQQELPGLRGFSPVNIKRMRQFYEVWEQFFVNRPLPADELMSSEFRPLPADELRMIKICRGTIVEMTTEQIKQ